MPSQPTAILAALHWGYPRGAAVVLPIAAVVSAYVVWGYAAQIRQVGRAWAWTLPALRVAAVATVGVALLRPAVSRPRRPAERGPLVVVVDDSRSMAVTDTGRPSGVRVAIAAALGRLSGAPRDAAAEATEAAAARLTALADDVARARSEVAYARLAGRDAADALARVDVAADALRSAAADVLHDAAADPASPLGRTLSTLSSTPAGPDADAWLDRAGDRARSAAAEAARTRVAADARLYDADPAVRAAADAVANLTRGQLAWAAVFDPRGGLAARLGPGWPVVAYAAGDRATPWPTDAGPPPPTGAASDLTGGVRVALDQLTTAATAADAEPPRAVVVLSDGRAVSGEPVDAAATAGVPVYAVAVATRGPVPDVSVADLRVPPVVRPGEPVTVQAVVRGVGLAGTSTDVTFAAATSTATATAAGDADVQVRRLTFAADDDRPRVVAFDWVPRAAAGPVAVSVRATPVAGEATDDDNGQERWTRVVEPTVRAAVVAPTDGPEVAAVAAALGRAADVRVTAAVGPAATAAVLDRSDVVVLIGVTARSLSAGQWAAVGRVADRGGGTVVVAAPGGFGPAVVASPLWRLLPFATSAPPVWTARPASTVRPTADADAPRLSADPAEEARRWSAFPSADGRLPLVDLRPDARPLLVAGGADDAANADAVPVLVERRIGAGRSLCLATDRSWQWRARDADAHDRFWAALVRTAAGPAYAAEQAAVSLDADAFVAPPGAAVRYRVRAVDTGGLAVARTTDRTLRLVGPAAQLVRTVPLTPRPGGRFDAVVVGLPAGEYMVETSWPLGPRVPLRVRPSYTAELADLTGDDAPLRRLAAATGGRLFRLDQLDRLAAALTDRTATPARPIDLPLWHGTYLVPLLVGLLTAEWALRRRAGLA